MYLQLLLEQRIKDLQMSTNKKYIPIRTYNHKHIHLFLILHVYWPYELSIARKREDFPT